MSASPCWCSRFAAARRVAVVLLSFVVSCVSVMPMETTVSAASTALITRGFTYDAPELARVGVPATETCVASSRQVAGLREGAASPSFEAHVAPTTPHATFVATEAAALADDHIVLGLRASGLEETAAKVGGRTLLSDPQWQTSLQQAIGTPGTRFTVALDGLSGSTPYSQVMSAVQNGVTPLATPTNWELAQLFQAGRIGDVTFVSGGRVVPNPWGG